MNEALDQSDLDHLRLQLRRFAQWGLAGALFGVAVAVGTFITDQASDGIGVVAFSVVVAIAYVALGWIEPRTPDRWIPAAYAVAGWLTLVTIIGLTVGVPLLSRIGDEMVGMFPVVVALYARWRAPHHAAWCIATLIGLLLLAALPVATSYWAPEARVDMVVAFAAGALLSIAGMRVLDRSRALARAQEQRIRASRDAERHAAEDLHRSERRYRQIVELSTEGIWVSDPEGRTTLANARAAEILGVKPGELQGRNVLEAIEPAVRDHVRAYLGSHPPSEPMGDIPARRADGSTVWLSVAATRLIDEHGDHFGTLAMFTDVSDRHATEAGLRASNEALDRLASVDALTGVLNRRSLDAAITERAGSTVPVGVLLIDVDRFKSFNDANGHQAGDAALRSVADAISAALRPGDRIYRYGGEEFLVLLERVSPTTALSIGERARAAVAKLAIAAQPLVSDRIVTVSIGVSVGRPDLQAIEAIISVADGALYAAKAGGRDRVVMGPVTAKRGGQPRARRDRGPAEPGPRTGLGPPASDPA